MFEALVGRDVSVFELSGTIRCERAIAELRSGRPVIIHEAGSRLAVLSLETVLPGDYEAFAIRSGHSHVLYLTPPRAEALDVALEGAGCVMPLRGLSHAEAQRLAYLPGAVASAAPQPASHLISAASELMRLALLLPAVVASDHPALTGMADAAEIAARDVAEARLRAAPPVEVVARTRIPLDEWGTADFVVFRGGTAQRDHVGLVFGHPAPDEPVPLRLHSSCITGDLFGSLRCDCGDQLRQSLSQLKALGSGVLLYLDQEGRGTGIAAKIRAYEYQARGFDTFDADAQLGFDHDDRRYDTAIAMLNALGIGSVRLMTNNPAKVEALRAGGIEVVERIPLIGAETRENSRYLHAKAVRNGHLLR